MEVAPQVATEVAAVLTQLSLGQRALPGCVGLPDRMAVTAQLALIASHLATIVPDFPALLPLFGGLCGERLWQCNDQAQEQEESSVASHVDLQSGFAI